MGVNQLQDENGTTLHDLAVLMKDSNICLTAHKTAKSMNMLPLISLSYTHAIAALVQHTTLEGMCLCLFAHSLLNLWAGCYFAVFN